MKRLKRVSMWSSCKPTTTSTAIAIWLWSARRSRNSRSKAAIMALVTPRQISSSNLITSCTPKRSRLLKSRSKPWQQPCELKKLLKDTWNSPMNGDTWRRRWPKLNSLPLVVKASKSANSRHSSSKFWTQKSAKRSLEQLIPYSIFTSYFDLLLLYFGLETIKFKKLIESSL